MAVIVTVLAHTLQLAALLFLPALLYLCLRTHTGKKAADMAALLCATVIFVGAVWLAFHPIRSCPKELESYMTEDRWQDILSVTPPIYNAHLPFFPCRIVVERADESELYWRTDWFPAGTTRTGVTPDGYDPVHGLKQKSTPFGVLFLLYGNYSARSPSSATTAAQRAHRPSSC